jgi:hypothetical protein
LKCSKNGRPLIILLLFLRCPGLGKAEHTIALQEVSASNPTECDMGQKSEEL